MSKGGVVDYANAGYITDGEAAAEAEAAATTKPRAGEHTMGPWRVHDHDAATPIAQPGDIVICDEDKEEIALVRFNAADTTANARRIVACVNACEGYPTEFLERSGLRSGIKGGAQAEAALAAQNRELREVLEHFHEWHANHFEDFSAGVNAELLCLANEAEAALTKHGR